MKRTAKSNAKQSIKQEEPFQLMIKKANKTRQKKLIVIKNGYIINNYGQHLRANTRTEK